MAHSLKLALAATIASLAFAAPAMANTYWASPGGSGLGDCSSAINACLLSNAVNAANTNGDQVILTPGTYTVSSTLSNTHAISIHGQAGVARPVVDGTMSTGDLFSLTGGASLSDLEVDLTGSTNASAVDVTGTGTLEDLIVNVTGTASNSAIFLNPSSSYTVHDTVVLNSSPGAGSAAIVTTGPLILRSVTAISTGPLSRGLQMSNLNDTTAVTVDAKNVILRGTQFDIGQFTNTSPAAGNTLNIDYSNYSPDRLFSEDGAVLNDGGHNQTTVDPVFEADGWHEAAGSPTIGAGYADGSAPAYDIDGDLRYVGAMDIGADQFPLATGAQALGHASSSAYGCTPVGNGYAQTQFSVQSLPTYAAASDGVITSWSTYVGAVDSNTVAELKVYDPTTQAVRAQSPIETGLTANSVNTFSASPGIPIHAGDSVAVGVPTGKTVFCQFSAPGADDDVETRVSATGDPQPGDPTNTGGGGGGLAVNLQAYTEPDADGDGYGDLTQDGCPTDPSTHGACPTPGGGGGGGTGGGGGGGTGGGGGGGGSGTPPPGPGPATHFKGSHLASHHLKVVGRFAFVDERCDRACSGTATLTAVVTTARRHHAIVLGHASFRTAASGTAHVKIKLSKQALALLRKHGHLAATLKTASRDATGQKVSSAARVTLKLARKRSG